MKYWATCMQSPPGLPQHKTAFQHEKELPSKRINRAKISCLFEMCARFGVKPDTKFSYTNKKILLRDNFIGSFTRFKLENNQAVKLFTKHAQFSRSHSLPL